MRTFLPLGFAMSALCNFGMGFADTVLFAAILWGVNGWFQGFGAPGSVVALSSWFSNRERGRNYGIWITSHSFGEGLTFFAIGWAVATFGWRFGYFVPAAIGLFTAVMMYALMRDRPRTMGLPAVADWKDDHVAESDANKSKGRLALQFSILRYPTMWILGLSSAANYVTRYAINSWGPLYLQEARGFDEVASGTMLMISTLAGVLGGRAVDSDKYFAAAAGEFDFRNLRNHRVGAVILWTGEHADLDCRYDFLRAGACRLGGVAGRIVRRRYLSEARDRRGDGRYWDILISRCGASGEYLRRFA